MRSSTLHSLLYLPLFLYNSLFIAGAALSNGANLALPLLLPNIGDDARIHCVSDAEWPEWQGKIDTQSCADTIRAMMSKAPPDRSYTFWTGAASDRPAVPWPWRLPVHTERGDFLLINLNILSSFFLAVTSIGYSG